MFAVFDARLSSPVFPEFAESVVKRATTSPGAAPELNPPSKKAPADSRPATREPRYCGTAALLWHGKSHELWISTV